MKTCLSNATGNANCAIGYKLTHFREQFNANILDVEVNSCKQHVSHVVLSVEKQQIINCLHTFIGVKYGQVNLGGFNSTEVDDLINFIAVG